MKYETNAKDNQHMIMEVNKQLNWIPKYKFYNKHGKRDQHINIGRLGVGGLANKFVFFVQISL